MTIINLNFNNDIKSQKLFFGESLSFARYDKVKYPVLMNLTLKMRSFFWQPYEIDMSSDKRDFQEMSDQQQFVFLTVLSRQIALDSIQQRAPLDIIAKYISVPELEPVLITWSFFEQIHSESYSHTIKNVLPNADVFFDNLSKDEHIQKCVKNSSKYYLSLKEKPTKENLLFALFSVNALEAIQFYASFACSFAFNENKLMKKNCKLIEMILRDEQIHQDITSLLIKLLVKEDDSYKEIIKNNLDKIHKIYQDVVDMEKDFARHIFSKGSFMGINEEILCKYIDYVSSRTIRKMGFRDLGFHKTSLVKEENFTNPIPFMDNYINQDSKQVAPQEEEKINYKISSLVNDVSLEVVQGFNDNIVYSKEDCPYCVKAKKHLIDRGISYKEYIYEKDFTKESLTESLKTRFKHLGKDFEVKTVPQIILEGEYVGGCDDLLKELL